jgi:hypothetical protein
VFDKLQNLHRDAHEFRITSLEEKLADEAERVKPVVLGVGDRLRFSTALLQQIHDEPKHLSVLVEIERIIRGPDGVKELWLKKVNDD